MKNLIVIVIWMGSGKRQMHVDTACGDMSISCSRKPGMVLVITHTELNMGGCIILFEMICFK